MRVFSFTLRSATRGVGEEVVPQTSLHELFSQRVHPPFRKADLHLVAPCRAVANRRGAQLQRALRELEDAKIHQRLGRNDQPGRLRRRAAP